MKRHMLPDLVITLFTFLFLFITIWFWPESGRPFVDFVIALLIGFAIGEIGIILDRYVNRRNIESKHVKEISISFTTVAGILFMIMSLLTVYFPVTAKYWIYSFLSGFLSILDITLIKNELKARKRYQWSDL